MSTYMSLMALYKQLQTIPAIAFYTFYIVRDNILQDKYMLTQSLVFKVHFGMRCRLRPLHET